MRDFVFSNTLKLIFVSNLRQRSFDSEMTARGLVMIFICNISFPFAAGITNCRSSASRSNNYRFKTTELKL